MQHIDTAFMYGNHTQIGEALGEQIRAGKVKREELFITTKLANNSEQKAQKNVVPSIHKALKELQIDYVDLVRDTADACSLAFFASSQVICTAVHSFCNK